MNVKFIPCQKCGLSYPRSVLEPVTAVDKRTGQMKQVLVCSACIKVLKEMEKDAIEKKKQQQNEKLQ